MKTLRTPISWLLIGDILAALVVTLIGFFSHYGEVSGWRWLTTFLPVAAAWFAVAPWLGVYRLELARKPLQSWRAGLAAFLSAPLAATLRGLWLNAVITPVFVAVLAATSALGFLVWRWLWAAVAQRIKTYG